MCASKTSSLPDAQKVMFPTWASSSPLQSLGGGKWEPLTGERWLFYPVSGAKCTQDKATTQRDLISSF